jgi:hypothetical protein
MNFDLTNEIKLDERSQIVYSRLRWLIYLIAIIVAFVSLLTVMFPTQYFTFSFLNPKSTKNNIVNPRDNAGVIPDHGRVGADTNLIFDAALLGTYSKAIIEIDLNQKSENLNVGEVSVRKSYQAFFYSETNAPDQLNDLSDSVLASYGESVYILSDGKSYPIDSVDTFNGKGYRWDDVKLISPDDLAKYEKQKLFTLASPHPNGTIIKTDKNIWYEIKNGQKFIVNGSDILSDRHPILVSASSLDTTEKCELTKKPFTSNTFICEIPLANFQNLIGTEYEFSVTFDNDIKIDFINVKFKKDLTWNNLRNKISEMIFRIKNNYAR